MDAIADLYVHLLKLYQGMFALNRSFNEFLRRRPSVGRTHRRQTNRHDIRPSGLWPVELKITHIGHVMG